MVDAFRYYVSARYSEFYVYLPQIHAYIKTTFYQKANIDAATTADDEVIKTAKHVLQQFDC